MLDFIFLKKSIVHKTIEHNKWIEQYSGTEDQRKVDEVIVENKVKQLIGKCFPSIISEDKFPYDDFTVYPKDKIFPFKFVALLNGISGYVAYKQKVDKEDLTGSSTKLERCYQDDFLLPHLFLLIDLYAKLKKNKLTDIPSTTNSIILKGMLENEIWLTINAYQVYNAYNYIYNEKAGDEKLKALVNKFLKFVQESLSEMANGEEICFPCGYAGHAIYLNLYKLNDKQILIRIDNLAPKDVGKYHERSKDREHAKPYLLAIIDKEKLLSNELIQYFFDLCKSKFTSRDNALLKIYNKKGPKESYYKFPQVQDIGFPYLSVQKVENCAVENFLAGMRYRLYRLDKNSQNKNIVFKWLLQAEKGVAIITSSLNPFDKNAISKSLAYESQQVNPEPSLLLENFLKQYYVENYQYLESLFSQEKKLIKDSYANLAIVKEEEQRKKRRGRVE